MGHRRVRERKKEREKKSSFEARHEFVLHEISDKILLKSIAPEQILKDEYILNNQMLLVRAKKHSYTSLSHSLFF